MYLYLMAIPKSRIQLHENIEALENLSPKEMEEFGNAHFAWATKLGESGNLISGDGLQEIHSDTIYKSINTKQ